MTNGKNGRDQTNKERFSRRGGAKNVEGIWLEKGGVPVRVVETKEPMEKAKERLRIDAVDDQEMMKPSENGKGNENGREMINERKEMEREREREREEIV